MNYRNAPNNNNTLNQEEIQEKINEMFGGGSGSILNDDDAWIHI